MKRLILIVLLTMLPSLSYGVDSLMTVGESRAEALTLLNLKVTGAGPLDSSTVDFFVKESAIRVCTDIGVPKGKMINITDGTTGYLVDDALIWIKGVILDTNKVFRSMKPLALEQLTEETYHGTLVGTTTRPSYYIRHGDSIRIYPPPAASDSIYVFYFARNAYQGTARPETTTVVIPVEYRLAVLYGTCQMSLMRLKDFPGADYYKGLYYEEVARLRTRFEFEREKKQ